jgi:hypothetical protein
VRSVLASVLLHADTNDCADAPCDTIPNALMGSCVDEAAPGVGFTCDCAHGYSWNIGNAACAGENHFLLGAHPRCCQGDSLGMDVLTLHK